MKKSRKNSFENHIREVLLEHKEPYVLGSWERFQRHSEMQKKQRIRKSILLIAASILLIFTFGYSWFSIIQTGNVEMTLDIPVHIPEPDITNPGNLLNPFSSQDQPVPDNNNVTSNKSEQLQYISSDKEPGNRYITNASLISVKPIEEYTLTEEIQKRNINKAIYAIQDGKARTSEKEYGNTETNRRPADDIFTNAVKHQHPKDFTFSMAYASVLNLHDSNTDLGVGGGFYTGWNVTDKIALSSGVFISQNQLRYNMEYGSLMRTFEEGEATLAAAVDLSHIQVNLVSLEIPLNISYSLNDRFSVSAGLSSVTYLKEQYEFTFEYEQTIQVLTTTNNGIEYRTEQVTFSETLQQKEPSLNGMDLAAFYTFSVGYQREIAGLQTVSIEPFLKMPTGRLTSRDIKYTTGGLQLRIFF